MPNVTVCENVTLDLSESSIRITSHPHLLVFIASLLSLLATLSVCLNVLMIAGLVYSRHHAKNINRMVGSSIGMSDIKKIQLISLCFNQLIVGCFCIPLAVLHVVNNGQWTLGPHACTAWIYNEALMELVTIYHAIIIGVDNYIMLRKPFKYRLLTSKTGYGMVMFSWAIPIAIFAIGLSLDWGRMGIENIFSCLEVYKVCILLFSKRFVLFILPLTVLVSFIVLLAMAWIVLKEIHRFHGRQSHQNHATTFRDSRLKTLNASTKHVSNKSSPNHSKEHKLATTGEESKMRYIIPTISQRCGSQSLVAQRHKTIKDKIFNRHCKAYSKVVVMVTGQCVYLVAISVFFLIFVYDPSKFPLWVNPIMTWSRYVHFFCISIFLITQETIFKQVKLLFNAF